MRFDTKFDLSSATRFARRISDRNKFDTVERLIFRHVQAAEHARTNHGGSELLNSRDNMQVQSGRAFTWGGYA